MRNKKTMFYTAIHESHDPHLANDLMQDCLVNLINNNSTIRKLDCCKIDEDIKQIIQLVGVQ